MNTKYNELEEVYEVDLKNTSGAELLAIETPNKYVTYAGLERAVRNVLSKAKDYDKGLAGGYNGTFPLTAATKGNIYLLPATKKYYICIKDYSGSQLSAPNSNFEELSVYANRSKLDNLIKNNIIEKDRMFYYMYTFGNLIISIGTIELTGDNTEYVLDGVTNIYYIGIIPMWYKVAITTQYTYNDNKFKAYLQNTVTSGHSCSFIAFSLLNY